MSKVEVYVPSEPEETVTYLTLVPRDDYVLVRAVNKQGKIAGPGNLLKIFPDGTYTKCGAAKLNGQRFRKRDYDS